MYPLRSLTKLRASPLSNHHRHPGYLVVQRCWHDNPRFDGTNFLLDKVLDRSHLLLRYDDRVFLNQGEMESVLSVNSLVSSLSISYLSLLDIGVVISPKGSVSLFVFPDHAHGPKIV